MNSIFKRFLLIIIVAFFAPYLFAQEEAQKFYDQGDYLQAAKIYNEQLKDTKKPSASLYYNFANSCYKLGLTPRAIANYYRAWRLRALLFICGIFFKNRYNYIHFVAGGCGIPFFGRFLNG